MTLQRRLTGDTSVEFMETRMDLPDYLAYTVELDRFLPPEEKDAQQKKMYVWIWKMQAVLTYRIKGRAMESNREG